jgi:hypothetical protein
MNNERRTEIGRALLERFNELSGEAGVDEDTVRDAICDLLHAAMADSHLKPENLNTVVTSCVDHVRIEREEERTQLWNDLAILEDRETMYAEARQAEQVRRIQHEMLPIKHRINQLEGTALYSEAEEQP